MEAVEGVLTPCVRSSRHPSPSSLRLFGVSEVPRRAIRARRSFPLEQHSTYGAVDEPD